MTELEAVVVLAGGVPPPAWMGGELPRQVYVIAADSGLDHARLLGLSVDLLIGDLDSVSEAALRHHPELKVASYPADKDKTDLELALDHALQLDPPQILVVGGSGGRLDHLLANASLLAAPKYALVEISWLTGESQVHVVRTVTEIHGSRGDLVSLLPYGGPAHGISTRGLRWPLHGETLEAGTTRGVSNQMTGPIARVQLNTGTLLAVHTAADLT